MDLLPAAAVAVGIYLVAKQGSFGSSDNTTPINFSVKNVNLTTSGITPVLKINLQAGNFTSHPVTVQQAQANVFINNEFYGQVTSYGNRIIEPGTVGEYPLELRLGYGQLYNELQDMWNGSAQVQILIDVQGNKTVDGVTSPLNLQHRVL